MKTKPLGLGLSGDLVVRMLCTANQVVPDSTSGYSGNFEFILFGAKWKVRSDFHFPLILLLWLLWMWEKHMKFIYSLMYTWYNIMCSLMCTQYNFIMYSVMY